MIPAIRGSLLHWTKDWYLSSSSPLSNGRFFHSNCQWFGSIIVQCGQQITCVLAQSLNLKSCVWLWLCPWRRWVWYSWKRRICTDASGPSGRTEAEVSVHQTDMQLLAMDNTSLTSIPALRQATWLVLPSETPTVTVHVMSRPTWVRSIHVSTPCSPSASWTKRKFRP